MTRDTRPEQHTRHIDVPVDPIEQKRDALKADRLELTANDFRRDGRILAADLLIGNAMALRGLDPITASPVVRTAHAWASCERSISNEADWAQELVARAATAMNFREITTADFLRGVAAALGGLTMAPMDASPTFRMGLKAVIECQRGRAQHTELAVAAPSQPNMSERVLQGPPLVSKRMAGTEDPLEHEPTRPHSVPTSFDEEPTRQHVEANPQPPPLLDPPPVRVRRPIVREDDAPEPRRGRSNDDDLTSARLIPRTEILKTSKP